MNPLTVLNARLFGGYNPIGETRGNRQQSLEEVERHLSAAGLTLSRFAHIYDNPLPVRTGEDANYHDQHFTNTHVDLVFGEPYLFAGEFHHRPRTSERFGHLTLQAPEQVHRFSYRLDKLVNDIQVE